MSIGTVGSVEVCKGRFGVVSYVMVVYGQQWLDKADEVGLGDVSCVGICWAVAVADSYAEVSSDSVS